jgi:hypothetical protein
MGVRRRQGVVAAALVLTAGCLTLDYKAHDVPTGTPAQAAATWQTYVLFAADPAREGASTPGLAGRLYLFGAQGDLPVAAPGKVQVRLYPDPPDGKKVETPLEVWDLDPETMRGKLQRDAIGWGYTLLLPWGTYSPDLTHVRLTVRFEPSRGGPPLYAQETHLALHGQGPPAVITTTTATLAPPAGLVQAAGAGLPKVSDPGSGPPKTSAPGPWKPAS